MGSEQSNMKPEPQESEPQFIDPKVEKVCTWYVPIGKKVHVVVVFHNVKTNDFKVAVDNEEIINKKVHEQHPRTKHKEPFSVEGVACEVTVESLISEKLKYSLEVDGQPVKTFKDRFFARNDAWRFVQGDTDESKWNIILDKLTLEIWVNGEKVESTREFVAEGTITFFQLNNIIPCEIASVPVPGFGMLRNQNTLTVLGDSVPSLNDERDDEFHEFDLNEYVMTVLKNRLQ